jgi:hypothetical protein
LREHHFNVGMTRLAKYYLHSRLPTLIENHG